MSDDVGEDSFAGLGRETWQLIIGRRIDQLETLKSETASYIHRMSAWMIGQLFVANGAGLTLIPGASNRTAQVAFASGIVLAMLCGLAAWAQAHVSYSNLVRASDPVALAGQEYVPAIPVSVWVHRLFAATLAIGLISLAAFVIGVAHRI